MQTHQDYDKPQFRASDLYHSTSSSFQQRCSYDPEDQVPVVKSQTMEHEQQPRNDNADPMSFVIESKDYEQFYSANPSYIIPTTAQNNNVPYDSNFAFVTMNQKAAYDYMYDNSEQPRAIGVDPFLYVNRVVMQQPLLQSFDSHAKSPMTYLDPIMNSSSSTNMPVFNNQIQYNQVTDEKYTENVPSTFVDRINTQDYMFISHSQTARSMIAPNGSGYFATAEICQNPSTNLINNVIPTMPDINNLGYIMSILKDFIRYTLDNPNIRDPKGDHVHHIHLSPQRYAKRQLISFSEFRITRIRIRAFTMAFQAHLLTIIHSENKGMNLKDVNLRRIRDILTIQNFMSKHNVSGRKAKSKGSHVWIINARPNEPPKSDGTVRNWEIIPWQRRIMPSDRESLSAKRSQPYSFKPQIWDPNLNEVNAKYIFNNNLPSFLQWNEKYQTIQGFIPEDFPDDSFTISITATYYIIGVGQVVNNFFKITIG